ncbi:MAG: type 1 fimbrial protein [Neisseriaceae bacterium]|nr:type 1 fimbrial protein [Neisseriaceae bacterium]MBP6861777.1 type 1 fimbrial protein [Neisseriaceae bacterium]
MKTLQKTLLALSLALPLSVFASTGGTITFLGEVTDTTCNVTVNGSSADSTVQLLTIASNDLAAGADSATSADINFEMSGCGSSEAFTKVGVRMVPVGDVTTDGNLSNMIADGSSAAIKLKDENGSQVPFQAGSETLIVTKNIPAAGATVNYPFKAHYTNETASNATEGKVKAAIQYTTTYE